MMCPPKCFITIPQRTKGEEQEMVKALFCRVPVVAGKMVGKVEGWPFTPTSLPELMLRAISGQSRV